MSILAVVVVAHCGPTLIASGFLHPSTSRKGCDVGIPRETICFAASSVEMSSSNLEYGDTVVVLTTPRNQTVTLVGTAHQSRLSQEQVQTVIQQEQPNVVLVELDPSRLPRIGISSMQDIQVGRVVIAAETILKQHDTKNDSFDLFDWWKRNFLDNFTEVVRTVMSSVLQDGRNERLASIKQKLDADELISGGEFLVAIRAAEKCVFCDTVILGDRPIVTTIQRAAQLAWDSGDPFGVLSRLQSESTVALEELHNRVFRDLGIDQNRVNDLTQDEKTRLDVALKESLKNDSRVRERLFQQWEEKVPEFAQAFLQERDIIMGESIRVELERVDVERVVAIVGLGHVPGIRKALQGSFVRSVDVTPERLAV